MNLNSITVSGMRQQIIYYRFLSLTNTVKRPNCVDEINIKVSLNSIAHLWMIVKNLFAD
jgi:hypothetical protein